MELPLLERELKPRGNQVGILCIFSLYFSGTNVNLGKIEYSSAVVLILLKPCQERRKGEI
jgi:hypothetical protein